MFSFFRRRQRSSLTLFEPEPVALSAPEDESATAESQDTESAEPAFQNTDLVAVESATVDPTTVNPAGIKIAIEEEPSREPPVELDRHSGPPSTENLSEKSLVAEEPVTVEESLASEGSGMAAESAVAEEAPREDFTAELSIEDEAVTEISAEPVAAEVTEIESPAVEPVAPNVAESQEASAEAPPEENQAVLSKPKRKKKWGFWRKRNPAEESVTPKNSETGEERIATQGSVLVDESIVAEPLPSEGIAAELSSVPETVASDFVAIDSPIINQVTAELPSGQLESAVVEPVDPNIADIASPTVDSPTDVAGVVAETDSETSTLELRDEHSIAVEEQVAPADFIPPDQHEPEIVAMETTDKVLVAPFPDQLVAVEAGVNGPLAPDAENTPAPEETPARIAEAGDESRSSISSDGSSLLDLPRVVEPEVMDDAAEVEAYASAAAQAWLDKIDDSFVEHAVRLVKGRQRGRALDIGSGPGQITLKLALRLSLWKFIGVDRSQKMIDEAVSHLAATVPVTGRLEFRVADGNRLDFPDATFDLVVCNSVLHHFAKPQNLLAELARVAKPRGAILLRDLRRPSRLKYPFHVRWHGRNYSGPMLKLYRDSVRAAYTMPELQRLLDASPLSGVRVFSHGSTHIGLERSYNW